MKDSILNFLENNQGAYKLEELINNLDISKKEIPEFESILNSLVQSGEVYFTKREKYMLFKYCHLKKGTINVTKTGDAFVDVDGKKVKILKEYLNGAINKDFVDLEIDDSTDPIMGRVIKIVKREVENIVGEIILKNDKYYVKPDNNKLKFNIEIKKEDLAGAIVGHKVLVKLLNKINSENYMGQIVEIIGHKDDPGVDIISIAYQHDIPVNYNEDAIKELDNIPSTVSNDECKSRKDLTNEVIFTIDGDDTKDIDDAIGIIKNDDETYILKVCIANVSYYVKSGSNLDKEALNRGNSVYLANTVIPMLPHYLSNGICSLNPNELRLAICCEMHIDKNGNVFDHDIYECVIKSRKQMTYKCVNKILEEDIIPEGYEEYVSDLKIMKELAYILRDNKIRKGYIDFDQEEAKVIIDDDGHCTDVKLRDRGVGEKLIEDFMIVANETVATHLSNMDLPCIYRVHEYPEEEKISEFLKYISLLGYQVNGKRGDISPKAMQKVLEDLNETPIYDVLSSKLLRCMTKAYYSNMNLGHYALAIKKYCHFTSPIRRYADLTVHRIIRRFLIDLDYSNKAINEESSNLEYISNHISETERKAVEAEREVDKMFMAEYMEGHIGDIFEGRIVSITNYGLYVSLPNKIEGLVHVSTLPGGYFEYDELSEVMQSNDGKIIYRLGDEVSVEVIAASKEEHTIDFKIYNEDKSTKK